MYNPIRKSKKIGKTQGGRVKDGKPFEKWSKGYFSNDIWTKLSESDEKWIFHLENPSKNFFHPCRKQDYIGVLKALPADLTNNVKAILLPRISKLDEKIGVEARRRYHCVIINPFPKSMEMIWDYTPDQSTFNHYAPWCSQWKEGKNKWILHWGHEEIRQYYLYHIFLHEIGHINQPWYHSPKRRESFAENFALEWARNLGRLKT